MGLTAAEAFILVSFILLLLLTWMLVADRKMKVELKQGQEALKLAREFSGQFSAEQRYLVLNYRDRLPEIEKHHKAIGHVIEKGATEQQVERGLELEERFGTLDPDLMTERLRLMEKERLRILLESVQNLPEDELRKLVDLASTEKLAAKINDFEIIENELKKKLNQVQTEKDRLENFLAQQEIQLMDFEQRVGRLRDEIKLGERLRADQENRLQESEQKSERLQAEKDQLEDSRQGIERSGTDVARQLHEKAGDNIEELGGRILDSGDVIFPESGLFETGSADILPEFDTLLREFCRPWFETLYNVDRYIETVRIEGHASSEFGSLSPREAFDENLNLSQSRASEVFKRCIDYGGDDEIADWVRNKMAAIGFSSARPVFQDGVEDRKASRRVVFGFDKKSADEAAIDPSGQ